MKRAAWVLSLGLVSACGGETSPPPHPPTPGTASAAASAVTTVADALPARPAVPPAPPYQPPSAEVFQAHGMTVWLLQRHNLPIVSFVASVPTGSAGDPKGKEGLAFALADLMDEGAGTRGALELARAVDDLGASLSTRADADASYVSLTCLKRNLTAAFGLMADVVARPKLDARELVRTKEIWVNDLRARAKDPSETLGVVYRAALFGEGHPYGHPVDGDLKSARTVTLGDLKALYASSWRPDRATLVAVGDVTREEVTRLVDSSFADWATPSTPAAPVVTPPPPAGPFPRLVVVDRADAPQSMIAVIRPGLAAADADAAPLGRANIAIGGGFTSRLNQDLREDHGYTYGASTRAWFSRGQGLVLAAAAVRTDATAPALKNMLADLTAFAKDGLTEEETAKTRSLARGELVTDFETVDKASGRLAHDLVLGFAPDHEAKEAVRRDAATKEELSAIAKRYFDPANATIVIVGPKATILPEIAKLGLGAPEMRDADGHVLK